MWGTPRIGTITYWRSGSPEDTDAERGSRGLAGMAAPAGASGATGAAVDAAGAAAADAAPAGCGCDSGFSAGRGGGGRDGGESAGGAGGRVGDGGATVAGGWGEGTPGDSGLPRHAAYVSGRTAGAARQWPARICGGSPRCLAAGAAGGDRGAGLSARAVPDGARGDRRGGRGVRAWTLPSRGAAGRRDLSGRAPRGTHAGGV